MTIQQPSSPVKWPAVISLVVGLLSFSASLIYASALNSSSIPTSAVSPSTSPAPPTPTPGCSPCAVSVQGNIYDSTDFQPLENARVLFEWEDRCWGEQRLELFSDSSGYYGSIQLSVHAVGQGLLTASFSGYQTEYDNFISCGDHTRDFHLDPLPTPSPRPEAFSLTDLENLRVTHPRGDTFYNLAYRLRNTAGDICWGHTYDRQNRFYNGTFGSGNVTIEAFAHTGYSPQPGDDLRLTCDGGRDFHIYLPAFSGYIELYVAADGATYYDLGLTLLAQPALAPTPSTTPTPFGFRSPSPPPSPTATMGGTPPLTPVPGCPSVNPHFIILTDGEPSQTVTYHMLWNNAGMPEAINGWWSSSTDWLEVSPHRGFGFDSQTFQIDVSLGDISSLGPGNHNERVVFHDDWNCNAWLGVTYAAQSPTPIPTPTPAVLVLDSGDYDGDGTAEIAVFRPASGLWAMRGLSRFYFGRAGDFPVSGDYQGDGTAGAAIYRPLTGLWAIRNLTRIYTGFIGSIPVPGDYDGNGSCDIGIYRQGLWSIPGLTRVWFGSAPYIPVPGDYTGDGRTDIAVFRGERNLWAVRGVTRIYFGGAGDRPVPGDYLGDGFRIPAFFRPSTGLWAVRGWTRCYFGQGGDFPVPADYSASGYDDPAVFRPATGLWAVQGLTRAYFGAASDLPATR